MSAPKYYTGEDTKGLGLGFSGSHRTGKTTLAREFAAINKFEFLPSPFSALARDFGFDMNGCTFEERLHFQWHALRHMESIYAKQTSFFVTDRTPIDFAAYLIADIPTVIEDGRVMVEAEDYVRECFRVLNERFVQVGVVQPGIPYVEEPGKPVNNSAYREKLNTIVLGLIFDQRQRSSYFIYTREATNQERRLELAAEYTAHLWKTIEMQWGAQPVC